MTPRTEAAAARALPPVTGPPALAVLRVGVALMWIQNVGWKYPPTFGEGPRPGALYRFTRWAVEYEVFGPYAWFVEHVVLPNFRVFGWMTLFVEAGLGAFLLIGLATRLWALVGVGQCLAITLAVLNAPHEWHWSYFLMILAHLTLAGTAAGRYHGLDGLVRAVRRSPGRGFALTFHGTARSWRSAVTALGAASAGAAVFVFTDGDPWEIVAMPPPVAIASVVLGALTCAAGAAGRRVPVVVLGVVYAAGAVVILAGQLVAGTSWLDTGGTAATFALWLGLGAGLLTLGLARRPG
jgi:thiosulfate dehydrogenase [quinone] large subunit